MRTRSDTSAATRRLQLDAFRAMGPTMRVAVAFEMSEEARAISAAGIRARRPDLLAAEADSALLELLLGPANATLVRSHAASAR